MDESPCRLTELFLNQNSFQGHGSSYIRVIPVLQHENEMIVISCEMSLFTACINAWCFSHKAPWRDISVKHIYSIELSRVYFRYVSMSKILNENHSWNIDVTCLENKNENQKRMMFSVSHGMQYIVSLCLPHIYEYRLTVPM